VTVIEGSYGGVIGDDVATLEVDPLAIELLLHGATQLRHLPVIGKGGSNGEQGRDRNRGEKEKLTHGRQLTLEGEATI
jgi:hypothetical protein